MKYSRIIYTQPDLTSFFSRGGIFKLLWSPGIDSKESIPPAYVALAGRYDNSIPTRLLAPIDCSKMSAQPSWLIFNDDENGFLHLGYLLHGELFASWCALRLSLLIPVYFLFVHTVCLLAWAFYEASITKRKKDVEQAHTTSYFCNKINEIASEEELATIYRYVFTTYYIFTFFRKWGTRCRSRSTMVFSGVKPACFPPTSSQVSH